MVISGPAAPRLTSFPSAHMFNPPGQIVISCFFFFQRRLPSFEEAKTILTIILELNNR
ncbi:MAG: hypothetical protein BSOLF_2447 [Candidatus Carbobacillus altaicus]|uniref:Uncharacterized protein n=1 Tax=Candidatus Carbonibacillus altaicus TaxID=2163959 RepID=A0A2R6XY14_9BACL|nr:MAG: hypothetical protein BSOLF_2447 [Candidatus Carbobacillus altaicus]